MYVRKGLEGVNLYELTVYGEALGKDVKVVELAGFDVNNFRNERVSYYINMYQGNWKPHMQRIIDRAQIYLPYIKQVFKEKNVPEDLIYLPIIESSFNPQAISKAGAAGLWQFMPMTGAIYNLKVNYWADDRFDPERSTKAAAEHLLRLNKNFKSWVIALAAYNAGGGRISSGFGARLSPFTKEKSYHYGVDIAGPYGTPILAVADGVISYAGWRNGYGWFLIINHANGYQTAYGHNSKLLVNVGHKVKRGDKIALIGNTGRTTGIHCHFEVRINGDHKNPMPYLSARF